MDSREAAIRGFIERYEIDVPVHLVENEIRYITLEFKHRMQYDTLTGGQLHLNAKAELDGQAEEIREAAFYEVKRELVVKAVIAQQNFTASKKELEAEAMAMAERQNSTIELVKDFFGSDFVMLERDIKERKAIDWIYSRAKGID